MPRLHLKETPEERAARKWRKRRKAERKAHRLHRHVQGDGNPSQRPPRDAGDIHEETHRNMGVGLEDESEGEGWVPPEGSTKIDPDALRAEVEERLFREKLFDAMEDDYDHRLDGVEAQFNKYGYVPDRWKKHAQAGGHDQFDRPPADPHEMTDDEYAEWIREGMWR